MKIERNHSSVPEARKYLLSLPAGHGLRVFPVKKKNPETGRMRTVSTWVGTYLEWLNRY